MQTIQKPSPASDAELITCFASKADDDAFSEIVRRYLPLVLAVTRRRLGNSGLAEDAAQQVFIVLSRKLRNGSTIPCLAAWLQKAAVFEASTMARREARHRRRAAHARELWAADDSPQADGHLDQALAGLSEKDRQVLMLHHFERLPFSRVASRLGISEAAAQRRGHRAMERLREILRSMGVERNANACSLWLAGSLAPVGTSLSPELIQRISALKHGAVQTLSWLPIAAVIALAGGTWATVAAFRPPAPPPSSVELSAPKAPARPKSSRFIPKIPNEDLSDEIREFISRAKLDSSDAWEWVKQRPQGVDDFLSGEAVRALADRDLPAADRFLEAIEGSVPRGLVIDEIFASRTEGNFESAILWLESVAKPNDLKNITFFGGSYMPSYKHPDYDHVGALGLARVPKVREWLIRQACEKAAATDETRIEKLAAELEGNERQIALGYAASLLLQRGDSRAYELLDELKTDLWNVPDTSKVSLRDPKSLLEWLTLHEEAKNRDKIARSLWQDWGRNDAKAAAAWAESLTARQRDALGVLRTPDPTMKRLLKLP